MIESLMLIALGFFVATLFAAIAAQFVWRRAVTVTTRSLLDTEAETANDARVRELDELMQRHRQETAPLEFEISRLRGEREALAVANDDLARQNTALANEINVLQTEVGRLDAEAEALRAHIARHASYAAERIAVMKQEIAALESSLGDRHGQAAAAATAPIAAISPEPSGAVDAGLPEPETATDEEEAARTLAEVKASLARLDAMAGDDRTAAPEADDDRTEAQIGDKALLARIKALEAGVAN